MKLNTRFHQNNNVYGPYTREITIRSATRPVNMRIFSKRNINGFHVIRYDIAFSDRDSSSDGGGISFGSSHTLLHFDSVQNLRGTARPYTRNQQLYYDSNNIARFAMGASHAGTGPNRFTFNLDRVEIDGEVIRPNDEDDPISNVSGQHNEVYLVGRVHWIETTPPPPPTPTPEPTPEPEPEPEPEPPKIKSDYTSQKFKYGFASNDWSNTKQPAYRRRRHSSDLFRTAR